MLSVTALGVDLGRTFWQLVLVGVFVWAVHYLATDERPQL